MSIPALGPAQSLIELVPRLFSEVKRPEREVSHSSPSSAEVKNEWSRTSASSNAFATWTGKSALRLLHMESVYVLKLSFLPDFRVSQLRCPTFRASGKLLRVYCYTVAGVSKGR